MAAVLAPQARDVRIGGSCSVSTPTTITGRNQHLDADR